MAKKQKCECPAGLPGWLVTFSDLMSLLLTFFVLLVSFASFENNKIKEAIISLQGALGVMRPSVNLITQESIPFKAVLQGTPKKKGAEEDETRRKNIEISAKLSQRGYDRTIGSYVSNEGVVLVALSPLFFDPGSADLNVESYETLSLLADIIGQYENDVRVEGYTSDVSGEAGSSFPTSWELSGARASAIVKYFIDKHGVSPKRLSFTGYGAFHPAVRGGSLQSRYLNDRVEIKLLTTSEPSDVSAHLITQHKDTPKDTETDAPVRPATSEAGQEP